MSSVVPDGWEVSKLEDRLYRPLAYGVLKPDAFVEDGVPMLRIQDVSISGLNKRKLHRISEKLHLEFKRTQLREGDLVISLVGTIGRVLEITKSLDGANVSRAFGVIGLKDDIDRHYIRQFLTSQKIQDWIQEQAQGNAQKVLNLGELRNLSIVHPPLPEQKKIASILTSVDEVIENTQKQIDKLQDLKKATMNELLTKGIGHTEFKDSELGRIPKSWEARQVQEIAKIIRGASPRPKGDPRYYGGSVPRLMGSDVTRDGKYVFPKTDFLTPEGAKLSRPMSKGGLTIVCSGTVGVPSILGVDACIHDGFLGLVDISNQCTTEFLYYAFLPLQEKFDSSATHGGVFTNLTTEILKEFVIAVPTLAEQREIVRNISSLDEHLDAQINKLSQIQSLKKSLMQDLLTGKVRVTVN